MKTRILMLPILLVSTISLLFLCPPYGVASYKPVGTVRAIIDGVTIVSKGGKSKIPKVGDPVFREDKIVTSKEGKIKILFDNDNILVLGFNTEIKIDELVYDPKSKDSKSTFSLITGKVRALVKKLFTPSSHFKIKTANSDIGVLGTDFIVTFDPNTDILEIFVESGNLSLKSPKKIWKELKLLDNHYTKIIKNDRPTTPEPIRPENIAPLKNELMVYEDISVKPQEEFQNFVNETRTGQDIEPGEMGDRGSLLPLIPPIAQEPQKGTVRVKVVTPFP